MDPQPLFPKCLLLEDDSAHVLLISRALRPLLAELTVTGSLAETRLALARERYDLVITDLNLPDASHGNHVAELVSLATSTPVMVLTTSSSIADAVEAMKVGARDFLVKNFDSSFNELLALSVRRLAASLERERERQELQRELEILRRAIQNSGEGFAVGERSGIVLYANPAFDALVQGLGGDPTSFRQCIGQQIKQSARMQEGLQKALAELAVGGAWHAELESINAKDAAWSLDLSFVQRGNEPSQDRVVLMVRDIGEQKRRERFQKEILATTTHDLKGPLGAIVISAEMLQEQVQGQSHELALRIASAAQGALDLIDEFLSARRIQEGSLTLRPAVLQLQPLLEELLLSYRSVAAARAIALELDLPADLELQADRLGLLRVLGNLLSNALKFTPKNGKVSLRAWQQAGNTHISVTDSGSGMQPSQVQTLFKRFSRLSQHDAVAGSGLGLFVVKAIVSAHGGSIEVRTSPGEGSSFEVSIPQKLPLDARGQLVCLDL